MYVLKGWNKFVAKLLYAPENERYTHVMSALIAVALIITVAALNY